jgi:tRNA acetyltransferase TAN1
MEHRLAEELKSLLDESNEPIVIMPTSISGLVLCSTAADPYDVIEKIRNIVIEDPWRVRFVLRLIPIEVVTNTELEDISKEAEKLAKRIKEDESYKVEIEKRFTNLHRRDIIEKVAEKIDRRVKLEEPDWIVLIEVVGKDTGISVLKPDDIFSLEKIKRSID